MTLKQQKLKTNSRTRKIDLKNKKPSKVLVKKFKKSNKKGGVNNGVKSAPRMTLTKNRSWIRNETNRDYVPLTPEEISQIIKIFEDAGLENEELGLNAEFEKECNNPLLLKIFGSEENCSAFFLELIKKVSLIQNLIDNNPIALSNSNNGREEKIEAFRSMVIEKMERKGCKKSSQNNLNNSQKEMFVNFINKVYSIDNILRKSQEAQELINSQIAEDKKQELIAFLNNLKEQISKNDISLASDIILSGFGFNNDQSKCEKSFKIFNLLKALSVLTNSTIKIKEKNKIIQECLKRLNENIIDFLNPSQEGGGGRLMEGLKGVGKYILYGTAYLTVVMPAMIIIMVLFIGTFPLWILPCAAGMVPWCG